MPFSRRSSYTLTLAVIAATPAILHAANLDPDVQNALWTCTMEDGQDWQCGNVNQNDSQRSATETEKPSAEIEKSQPVKPESLKTNQKINGAWTCETNAAGGWSCLDNKAATTIITKPVKTTAATSAPVPPADSFKVEQANLDWYSIPGASTACHGIYLEPDPLSNEGQS